MEHERRARDHDWLAGREPQRVGAREVRRHERERAHHHDRARGERIARLPVANLLQQDRVAGGVQREIGAPVLDALCARAEQAEQRALDQLRDSAQQLAKNMMAQNGQQQGQDQQGQRFDPLGRPLDEQGSMAGGTVKIPDQSDLARAREILEELRRRAGEANRAQQELEYIERLLKQFN